MKKVGEVVSRFSRFIICKSHKNAKTLIGKTVYSEKKELVGMVVDILGPVERPYLKILKKNGENAQILYVR
jgi:rRNA processing protein Gar1